MKQVTVHIADENFQHFIELAKNLNYVQKIETNDQSAETDVIENIKTGLKEVALFQKGALITTSAKSFLDEL